MGWATQYQESQANARASAGLAEKRLRFTDQRAGLAEDDRHRELTGEHELADVADQREAELRAIESEPHVDAAETNLPDIRDIADREPRRLAKAEDDWTRIPTAGETADNVTRAQRALAELEQRRHIEQRRADEEA